MFVIATTSPPARRSRSATTLSSAGTYPWRMRDPQVRGMPAIATASLTATRMPESTPSQPSARTRHTRTIAFSGSSAASAGWPGSRTASTGVTDERSCESSRSNDWETASATARSRSASASSTENPQERASSWSSSGWMRGITAALLAPERSSDPTLVERAERLAVEHDLRELPALRLERVAVGVPSADQHRPRTGFGRDRAGLEQVPAPRRRPSVVGDLDQWRDHVVQGPDDRARDAGEEPADRV